MTEDPETVGAGQHSVEGGIDDAAGDLLSGVGAARQSAAASPTLGVSFGLSSIAELQLDGGFYKRLTVTDREPAPLVG